MRSSFLAALLLIASAHAQPVPEDSVVRAPDSVSTRQAVAELMTPAQALGEYDPAYYQMNELNRGLPDLAHPASLLSPQGVVEHFVRTAQNGDFDAAAHALNLNHLPQDRRAEDGRTLAAQLFYVMDRQVGFDWEGLPDRPDGADDRPMGQSNPLVGEPRRSIRIGSLDLDGRDIAIRVQRVRVGEATPVWVFSPQTVANIPVLFDRFGPGPIDRVMPDWARAQVWGAALWTWLALTLALVLLILIAWGVSVLTRRTLDNSDSLWLSQISGKVAKPFAVWVAAAAFWFVASVVLAMPRFVTLTLLIVAVFAFVWFVMRTINAIITVILERDKIEDIADLSTNERGGKQRQLTYLSVGRRVVLFVVVLFAIGIIAAQFGSLERFGVSLMASAGVLTILLGIAAQPVLGNIIASIQIALAKPVRIGDSVYYDETWGYVEDITYTYILIKSWDKRRLVVPLRYFITHPFENWTKRDAHLIKPIYFHADYTIDVDKVRARFEELLRASDLWDEEEEPNLIVYSAEDETLKLRALCSASNPSDAWTLHCELREKLVAYVRDLEGGAHLPRQRVVSTEGTTQADRAAAAEADVDE
jgi:small-conductance mechanosensitive channel